MNRRIILSLRPVLRLLPHPTRGTQGRVPPYDPPTDQAFSTPLNRGSVMPLCALCIEAGRATEATFQTREGLGGCDEHIAELEQHGRAAIRRQRSAHLREHGADADRQAECLEGPIAEADNGLQR
jgi:hypothetical protein